MVGYKYNKTKVRAVGINFLRGACRVKRNEVGPNLCGVENSPYMRIEECVLR